MPYQDFFSMLLKYVLDDYPRSNGKLTPLKIRTVNDRNFFALKYLGVKFEKKFATPEERN